MKNFFEHVENRVTVLAERVDQKGNKELDIRANWQMADQINSNGRRYRRSILEREIRKINEKISKGQTIWGASFHPADGVGKPSDISHKWTKIWMEADGSCLGDMTILSTQNGKDMQILVQHGKIGISSRGRGTTIEKEELINGKMTRFHDVNDDFNLDTPGDFVCSPSVSNAVVGANEALRNLEYQLNEAGSFPEITKIEDNNMGINFNESLIEKLINIRYSQDISEGKFSGSLEEWKKRYGKVTRAAYLVGSDQAADIPSALRLMGEHLEALKFEKTPQREKVSPRDIFAEAILAGVDPKVMAERINSQIERVGRTENDAILTSQQIRGLMQEAQRAGIDPHSEEMAKYLESVKSCMVNKPKEMTLDEEVEALFTALQRQGILEDKSFIRKVLLKEKELKRAEEDRLKNVQKRQRLVSEALNAGASEKDIKKIIGE